MRNPIVHLLLGCSICHFACHCPAQEDPQADKFSSPVREDLDKLREEKKRIADAIKQKKRQQILAKFFGSKIKKLADRYQLNQEHIQTLEIAAQGAIARRLHIPEPSPIEEDIPDWADSDYATYYLYREGQTYYFGYSPDLGFASKQTIWKSAVENVLTPEQREQRKREFKERRDFHVDSVARTYVAQLDSSLRLNPDQREQARKIYIEFINSAEVGCSLDMLDSLTACRLNSDLLSEKLQTILTAAQVKKWEWNQLDE